MQGQRYVDVTINPDGTTTIEAVEFHGVGCKAFTDAFGEALGQTIEDREKDEYFEGQAGRVTVCNG